MSKEKDRKRLENQIHLLSEVLSSDPKLSGKMLKDSGVNLKASVVKYKALIRRHQGKARLKEAKDGLGASSSQVERLREQLWAHLNEYDVPLERLKLLVSKSGSSAIRAKFRNLETVSAEDALEMLEEVMLLRLIQDAGLDVSDA